MDLIVYRRQFGPNDDRRHFRAQSSQCQIICASASLTSSVKRELVQRGWCHPKKIAMVKLSDGFTVPKSVRHLVVDEQACVQHGIPFESAESPDAKGESLFEQLHWVLSESRAATALVFVPTSVPVGETAQQIRAMKVPPRAG